MKLKEIPRTATFAWSPDPTNPTVVTGTAAGTIDANFSAATELELWKLDLLDHSVAAFTAAPTARIETDSRFHDIAVSSDGQFVVGAMESGVVESWKLPDLSSAGTNNTAHSGAVKSVAFSPREAGKFATGGAQGQVFVWNVQDLSSPFTPGTTTTQRHDDIESVSWNSTAAHILASGGNKGFASIWDTRRKREVLHLHYSSPTTGARVPISSVQWHPTNSTKLATASLDDNEPVICIWDLKNVNSPERVLRGHNKGVLSLDWCSHDENLMLSGGRDNATLLWNPTSGEELGTYPISVDWAFKTQFNPHMPDLFASASFDGKISVQTLQDTSSAGASANAGQTKAADGADFWDSDSVMDAVHPAFKLQQPPKWLVRPVSATFGFGAKLVVVRDGKVEVKSVTDSAFNEEESKEFSNAVKSQKFAELAARKTKDSKASGTGWELLDALLKGEEIAMPEDPIQSKASEEKKGGSGDDDDDDDEFNIVPPYAPSSEFELLGSKHPTVAAAILSRDFDLAVSQLIAKGEPGDALLVASFGSPDLVKRAQNAYLNAHADKKPYLRAAWSVATKNLDDIVLNSELKVWPSVLRSVQSSENTDANKEAIYKLGKRLVDAKDRENAIKVYLAGNSVGAAASLWLDEVQALEKEITKDGKSTAYVAHVRALQEVVEKLVVATSKLGLPKMSDPGADRLYSAFRDYADIAAQQGDLSLAKLFLDMLPEEYAADKQRVHVATEAKQPAVSSRQTRGGAPGAVPGAIPGAVPGMPMASRSAGRYPPTPSGSTSAPTQPIPMAQPNFGGSPVGAPAPVGAPKTMPSVPRARGAGSSGTSSPAPAAMRPAMNPYAPQGISPAAASVAASNAAAAAAAATPAAGSSVNVPPPPAVGSGGAGVRAPPAASGSPAASGAAGQPGAAPFKGWNDIPELPNNMRRTPAAPTRVAPTRAPATVAPPSAGPTPRSSVSGPSGAVPPPPPAASGPPRAGAKAMSPVGQSAPGAPPSSRPANPYAMNPGSRPSSRAGSTSSKPNPYAPSPSSTPPTTASSAAVPPPRPGSRSAAPPPRARVSSTYSGAAVAPPPPAAASTPYAPPPAAAPPTTAAVPPPPPAAAAATTASVVPPPPSSVQPPAGTARTGAKQSGKKELQIPENLQPIFSGFDGELQRVRPIIEAQYAKQFHDTARRLEILYDRLTALSPPLVDELLSLSNALTEKDYTSANQTLQSIGTNHAEETGEWFTGIRRLVKMSAGVPVSI